MFILYYGIFHFEYEKFYELNYYKNRFFTPVYKIKIVRSDIIVVSKCLQFCTWLTTIHSSDWLKMT